MQHHYRCIRWILGDQLNENHSWFSQVDDTVLYVIAELQQETRYTRHHVQKLCAFFAAMERFADVLVERGHRVLHLDLAATATHEDLCSLMSAVCEQYGASELHYQRPDEYRLLTQLRNFKDSSAIPVTEYDTEHFILPFTEIEQYFPAARHQRMETFYRKMRSRFRILMEDDEPVAGRWNFDAENRNKLRADDIAAIPQPLIFATDVSDILARLDEFDIDYFGKISNPLPWPISRQDSLQLLDHFCEVCLPCFGRFQDALTGRSPHSWSLYHSRLSFALNSKLISPMEVIDKAISQFHKSDTVDIAAVEGFVRQILGWREFVRGIYWRNMPNYATRNHYNADRSLPDFFWSGQTRMRCLHRAISESLEHAYAHHIQRLMVTGNFCLITGIDPDQVDAWYLGIYIDAIEWVEMPNTRGMALYGDGGLLGTKPYAAGGNYINKMSDYCSDCFYKVSEKTGDRACPLNSLYWHFMYRHREELMNNQRLRMIYGSWNRMGEEQQQAILEQAERHLAALDKL
ncbi:MAG: cryptochrome/photolyase family protein [Proteobacteria bacterium]|nr:cryptochrome/photolyase family protein [Pseudomonadota bacterium]MDA0928666.1 cryptochrome/photolyase family protein [Pseudomonadota bacterium]